ncbi:MAG: ATP-binding protein [Lachnospiraceae bacterium]|nr:ATP-binding protein [Lachnospiraceae bacterium]
MYRKLKRLAVYNNIGGQRDNILFQIALAIERYQNQGVGVEWTVEMIYRNIHRLLDLATEYGFDGNLWQNYLTFLLVSVETPFGMVCEKAGAKEGTVNLFAKADFAIFKELFDYDFAPIEKELGINCFSIVTNYHAVVKNERSYNHIVRRKVRALSARIAAAKDAEEIFGIVTGFYADYGVGKLGLNKAFRVQHLHAGGVELNPITNTDDVRLCDLVGYERQKERLLENTAAFVAGKAANNVLLYGDAGTGKSTSIKAILNEFYDQGLRMIEIYKHQFEDLSAVISQIKNRNYRFIIYMDDLSFEEFEIEYKYLKAVIEGGLETKPDNVLIYATSNRRHLIRETWGDRSDMTQDELHHSDTMQEKLSLVARFGVSIHYGAPTQKEYFDIVEHLAASYGNFGLTKEELLQQANAWEMRNGGLSGRTAQQFITYMADKSR